MKARRYWPHIALGATFRCFLPLWSLWRPLKPLLAICHGGIVPCIAGVSGGM